MSNTRQTPSDIPAYPGRADGVNSVSDTHEAKMSTAKQRIPVTLQLVPGKDDDLLEAIQAIPMGRRNTILKAALSAGLNLPIRRPADQLSRLEDIWQALQDMPDWLERKFERLGTLPAATDQADPVITPLPRLTPEEKARRAAKMDKATW